jgi:hypothetical protein
MIITSASPHTTISFSPIERNRIFASNSPGNPEISLIAFPPGH